jgi:inorganic phosphate transporter, PiT family
VAALVVAIVAACAFSFTNGAHDAGVSIATLVATRGASWRTAVPVAAVATFLGPLLFGTAVAEEVAHIVTVPPGDTIAVVAAGLLAATAWNVATYVAGIPSSSGHALVGGLVGAALVAAGVDAVNWGGLDGLRPVGLFGVLIALAVTPFFGLAFGFFGVRVARRALRSATQEVNRPLRRGQWVTSFALAFGHGANDAQKAIGLATVVLVAHGDVSTSTAPLWVKLGCGGALTAGTMLGGRTIVRTIGRRLYRIRPLDGFVSSASGAAVILASTAVGAPISGSQVMTSAVVGTAGARHRWRHVGWETVRSVGVAWVTTLPACALLGALIYLPWSWIT